MGERYYLEYDGGRLVRVALPGSIHDATGVLRAALRRLRRHERRVPWGQRGGPGDNYYALLDAVNAADRALRRLGPAPREDGAS